MGHCGHLAFLLKTGIHYLMTDEMYTRASVQVVLYYRYRWGS